MATIMWQTLKDMHCDRVKQDVALVEERIYPADFIPYHGDPDYQVRSRRCTYGTDCNLAGYACRWSGLNPDYDPFAEA
jgi:hypothetical protein